MEKNDGKIAPADLLGGKGQSAPETVNSKILHHEGFVKPEKFAPDLLPELEGTEGISTGVEPPGREAERNREVDSFNAAEPAIVLSGSVESADPVSDTAQQSLEDWAVHDWSKSGITHEVAHNLGFKLVQEKEITEILGFSPRTASGICEGYAIHFLDPVTGQPMLCQNDRPYIRIRMRYPAIMGVDKAKYLSPQNAGQHAFIQPSVHGDYIE